MQNCIKMNCTQCYLIWDKGMNNGPFQYFGMHIHWNRHLVPHFIVSNRCRQYTMHIAHSMKPTPKFCISLFQILLILVRFHPNCCFTLKMFWKFSVKSTSCLIFGQMLKNATSAVSLMQLSRLASSASRATLTFPILPWQQFLGDLTFCLLFLLLSISCLSNFELKTSNLSWQSIPISLREGIKKIREKCGLWIWSR